MVSPNWPQFEVNSGNNPQAFFEQLCYTLFCKEHQLPMGAFRYKNQAGIETEPVQYKGEWIGWQAKYYEGSLSVHKKELLKMVKTVKIRYPKVVKVIVYTNTEWGQGKGQDAPKAKSDIEDAASKVDLKIEWKSKSFFESPYLTEHNLRLMQFFFMAHAPQVPNVRKRLSKQKMVEKKLLLPLNEIDFSVTVYEPSYKFIALQFNLRSPVQRDFSTNETHPVTGVSFNARFYIHDLSDSGIVGWYPDVEIAIDKRGFWDVLREDNDPRRMDPVWTVKNCGVFYTLWYERVEDIDSETDPYAGYPSIYYDFEPEGSPYHDLQYGVRGCYSKRKLTRIFDPKMRVKS